MQHAYIIIDKNRVEAYEDLVSKYVDVVVNDILEHNGQYIYVTLAFDPDNNFTCWLEDEFTFNKDIADYNLTGMVPVSHSTFICILYNPYDHLEPSMFKCGSVHAGNGHYYDINVYANRIEVGRVVLTKEQVEEIVEYAKLTGLIASK